MLRKKRIQFRHFLRNPIMVGISYLLFILSFSYLGSKTFWINYYIWEVPSLILGAAGSLGVISIISIFIWIILSSSYTKKKFHVWWTSFIRHGYITYVLLVVSIISFSSSAFVPAKTSPVFDLLNSLSKKRNDHHVFLEKWQSLEKYNKYKNDPEFIFLKRVYNYREPKEWKHHEYENWANYFSNFHENKNKRISLWANMLTADCLDRMNRKEKANSLYKLIVSSDTDDAYVKWWSYQEIGNFNYFKGNHEEAIKSWEKATNFINSPGANQNIAIVYEEQGEFELSDEFYNKALYALEQNMRENKNVSLGENTANLFVSWGNMYRLWAKSIDIKEDQKRKEYIGRSKYYLLKAQVADPAYLDAYWSMVRLHIEQKEYNLARWIIEKALFVLNHNEQYELRRFNYQLLGKKYAAYLALLTDFYDQDQLCPTPSTLELCKELIGFQHSRKKSIEDFFQAAEESSVSLGVEKEMLKNQDFIEFIN